MNMKLLTFVLLIASCSHDKKYHQEASLPGSLKEAVNSSFRSPENEGRDEYLHPLESLEFFGIKPNMTVVEVSPGAGYFTEILAPYLAPEGQYYMAVPRLPSRPPRVLVENERKIQDILLRNAEVASKTKFIPLEPIDKRNQTKKEFADLVINFNNVHNWVAKKETKEIFGLFYDILKPGGVLGITQHRIRNGQRKMPKSGYMTEAEVILLAQTAGFKFIGKSEINANPKDKAGHPGGVWALPPTLRHGDKDRRKYESIGESDKMTLKFIKPNP